MSVSKTEAGLQVIKDRTGDLTPRQRSALILVDGKRTLAQLLAATAAAGVAETDVRRLFDLGLVKDDALPTPAPAATTGVKNHAPPSADPAAPADPADPADPAGAAAPTVPAQERYQRAYPLATKLTAALGLRGFRLNLAVEAAGSYEQLRDLAPKILDAVGAEKFAPLKAALKGE